jgi:hypothetical protein
MTEDVCCGNCAYWLGQHHDGVWNVCRRYPPMAKPTTNYELGGGDYFVEHGYGWPVLRADGWCGEFTPKQRPQP